MNTETNNQSDSDFDFSKIQAVHISGKRWFDKTYGNTYCSVKVAIKEQDNDNLVYLTKDYTYGYGDFYDQLALDLFKEHYNIKFPCFHVSYLSSLCRRVDIVYFKNVCDVQRKKDLKQ